MSAENRSACCTGRVTRIRRPARRLSGKLGKDFAGALAPELFCGAFAERFGLVAFSFAIDARYSRAFGCGNERAQTKALVVNFGISAQRNAAASPQRPADRTLGAHTEGRGPVVERGEERGHIGARGNGFDA